MEHQKSIRVVLADDHPMTTAGFALTLGRYGIEVVGEARTPEEAETKYVELSPDVLVLDVRFGDKMTGLDVARSVLEKHPKAAIVFLSQFDQDSLIADAYRLGAFAFITKDREPADVAMAIERAMEGKLFFLPQIAERLARLSVRKDTASLMASLDKNETNLFVMLARGFTIAETADAMGVSQKTISNHSHALKVKLGVSRTADLTRLAVKHGYIDSDI